MKIKDVIIAGNKDLAEFRGYRYYPYVAPEDPSEQPPKQQLTGWFKGDPKFWHLGEKIAGSPHHRLCRSHNDLRYNLQPNWIWQVVEQIETLELEPHGKFGVYISSNGCSIQGTNFRSDKVDLDNPVYFSQHHGDTKLLATWEACVHFVRWYKTQVS